MKIFYLLSSGLSIEETEHPAITICSQGYSEEILQKALFKQMSVWVLNNTDLVNRYNITNRKKIQNLTREVKDEIFNDWKDSMYPGLEGSVKDMVLSLVSADVAKIQMMSMLSRGENCSLGLKKCEPGWTNFTKDGRIMCIRDFANTTFENDTCIKNGARRLYAAKRKPRILDAFKDFINESGNYQEEVFWISLKHSPLCYYCSR